jgi:GrpB-like predicted nucleotidyltransferase (UPF0157 family)
MFAISTRASQCDDTPGRNHPTGNLQASSPDLDAAWAVVPYVVSRLSGRRRLTDPCASRHSAFDPSLAMRNILVVPYDALWPEQFRQEAATICTVFGQALISIYHIGSTSIPGMSAKPIIDIMPIVHDIETVEGFNPAMMQLGYESKGENGIPGRRYFVKGGDAHRTHHVHAYALDSPEIQRHLDLRDYLIAHAAEAQQYADLKVALARQFPHDIDSYVAGKDGFIKETLQKAQKWRAAQMA